MTPLFSIAKIGPNLTADIHLKYLFPVLQTLAVDPVANIRLNVAKCIPPIMPVLKTNKDIEVSKESDNLVGKSKSNH